MIVSRWLVSGAALAALTLFVISCDTGDGGDAPAAEANIARQSAWIAGTAGVCTPEAPERLQMHVVIPTLDAGDSIMRSYNLEPGKPFVLEIDHIGVVCLDFTAPSYERTRIYPILLRDRDTVALDVNLRPYQSMQGGMQPALIGDFNNWDWESAAPMQAAGDGKWSGEIPGGSGQQRYQLIGVVPDRSINGTEHSKLEYDGAGDYYSVVDAQSGAARISFDASALPAGDCMGEHTLSDDASRTLAFELMAMGNLEDDFYLAARQQLIAGVLDERPQPALDLNQMFQAIGATDGATATDLKRYAFLHAAIFAHHVDAGQALSAMSDLGPTSPVWTIDGRSELLEVIPRLMQLSDGDAGGWNFLRRLAAEHPVADVRARSIFSMLTYANLFPKLSDSTEPGPVRISREQARDLYQDLLQKYSDSRWLLLARDVNPDRKISPRANAPIFALPTLDDSTRTMSVDTVHTPYVLFHFWQPDQHSSQRSISAVSDVYRIVGGDSLMIISVAVGDSREEVREIRNNLHPMPWAHAFVKRGSAQAIENLFNIGVYPNFLLVSHKGLILADNAQFRNRGVSDVVRRIIPDRDPVASLREEQTRQQQQPGYSSFNSPFNSPFGGQRRGTPMPRRR